MKFILIILITFILIALLLFIFIFRLINLNLKIQQEIFDRDSYYGENFSELYAKPSRDLFKTSKNQVRYKSGWWIFKKWKSYREYIVDLEKIL